ncbi:hypothetical protein UFOVP7_38 [uncultured Caudovirales phage]|uniref:C1q domain-containing protein n=1 Tax=uncultured Caudovirales phage TaxID=2100421 RepID=A0A6J5KL83_9CAUD|nr:hypothetical protein UFOVP7_38 [uncultured Caudovirales phage]
MTTLVPQNMIVGGPAFSAYLSSNQSVSSGVFTKVACNTEEFDTNSNYDNATNYRFTPTVAGYYQVNGSVNFTGTGTRTDYLASIYKNGTEFKRGNYTNISNANNDNATVSALIYFNGSTDYVELYAYQTQTTPSFGGGVWLTYFQGILVRAA